MLTIKNLVYPTTLEQAHEYALKPKSVIIGGMLWLKMQNREVDYAIDLSKLGLDQIEETEEEFKIGAMVCLRDLEKHVGLNHYTNNAIRESVRHIVGVQFRNLASVGGSLFGRFGFSDVLTCFLALDAYVELFPTGVVSIEEFANMRLSKDILVRVIVKKSPLKVVYKSMRNTSTDFPVLTCAATKTEAGTYCTIGARPLKAMRFYDENHDLDDFNEENMQKYIEEVSSKLIVGGNLRGSKEYRQKIAKVLMKRALLELEGGQSNAN